MLTWGLGAEGVLVEFKGDSILTSSFFTGGGQTLGMVQSRVLGANELPQSSLIWK